MKKPPSITNFSDYLKECREVSDIWQARRLSMPCYLGFKLELQIKHPQVWGRMKQILNHET